MGFTKEYLQELLDNWCRYKDAMKCSESEITGVIFDCDFIIFLEKEDNGNYCDEEINLKGDKILEFKNYGYDCDITIEYNGHIIDTSANFYNYYYDSFDNTIVSI